MSLIKERDSSQFITKQNGLYRFSWSCYIQYFMVPELIILGILVALSIIFNMKVALWLVIIYLLYTVFSLNKRSQTFIKYKDNKLIYRQKDNLLKQNGQKLGIINRDEQCHLDYQIKKIEEIQARYNHYVIKGEVIKRSFVTYGDEEEICVEEEYVNYFTLPKLYQLDRFAIDNILSQ